MTKLIFKSFTFLSLVVVSFLIEVKHSWAGSLYLPLQLSPEIENRIEKLMVLANKPIIKRPIPIKAVYEAVEQVKASHPSLAGGIEAYLNRFERRAGVVHSGLTLSVDQQRNRVQPTALANQRGRTLGSSASLAFSGYWAVNDFAAVNIGGIYQDETLADDQNRTTVNQDCAVRRQAVEAENALVEREEDKKSLPNCYLSQNSFDGSFISLGWDAAQLDIGYRPHWLGPLQDSAMLISTEAASMPSITLSNILPFEKLWGLQYELFYAQMSESLGIDSSEGGTTSGNPKLFGVHVSFSPIDGFSISANRLMQYGGGDRNESIGSIYDAFFNAKEFDNVGRRGLNFGNQLSSVSTRYTFSGKVPISVYATWAGEDASKPSDVHLGNSAIAWGLHLPILPFNLNATIEGSEWQNAWYVNGIYQDGLTHQGSVIGHWGGNRRAFGESGGAQALSGKIIWESPNGWEWTNQYRQLKNNTEFSDVAYSTAYEWQSRLSMPWKHWIVGAELVIGSDVFGEDYSQFSGFIRW